MDKHIEVKQSDALDRALASANGYPKRPGRILTEIIYGAWCDLCDDHINDFPNYQEASIALTRHLDENHKGWASSDNGRMSHEHKIE